jgi:hypothetical protein
MRNSHSSLRNHQASLAIRHTVNLHEAVETVSNHAMGQSRRSGYWRRTETFDPLCQKSGGNRVTFIGGCRLSIDGELNRLLWGL